MMNATYCLAAFLVLMAGQVEAMPAADTLATVSTPKMKPNDSWVFNLKTDTGQSSFRQQMDLAVERVDGDTMLLGVKKEGAPIGYVVVGIDWSSRGIADGKEIIINRPFTFPMSIGTRWVVDWEVRPHDTVLSGHSQRDCTAEDWEDVTVPAGTFHTMKIVCKGLDDTVVDVPTQTLTTFVASISGTTNVVRSQTGGPKKVERTIYEETYYAPEIKYFVRALDEQFDESNVRIRRLSEELTSFKPGT